MGMKNIIRTTLILLTSYGLSLAQSIDSVKVINGVAFCTGSNISATTYTSGSFGVGNIFTAVLSNASGGFVTGTTPLIVVGNAGSAFTAIVPNVPTQSAFYRIKVSSTNPVTSSINDVDLTINQNVSIGISSTNACSNIPSLLITKYPANGVYSGASGAIGNNFYPSLAPIGLDTVIYSIAANGCVNSDTVIVNVIQTPNTPQISGNSVICSGALSNLIIGNSNAAYTYNWFNGAVQVASNINSYDASTTGVYTVVANNNGCSATSQIFNLAVSNAPANMQIIANDTICQSNNPILLSGIPAGGSFGTSNVSGGYFTPNTVGGNLVTYSIQNQYGCVFNTSKNIVVSPKATITFNPIAPVCSNATVVDLLPLFTITGGSGTGITTFSGIGVSGNSFNTLAAGIGNHSITCNYVDVQSCPASQIGNIQVLGNSIVNFTIPQNICLGTDSIVLIGAPTNGTFSGSGVINGVFYPGIAGLGISNITYTIPSTTTSCSASTTNAIAVYNLTADAGANVNTNCGLPTSLTASTNYTGVSNISYSWSPTIGLSNSSLANPTCAATNNTDYIVTTSVNGCVATDTVNVNVTPAQFNVFFTNQTTFTAPPFNVAFSNNTPNPYLYSFAWDFGDGSTLNSNSLTVVHQYLTNGTFNVTLTATNNATGCVDTYSVQSAVITSNACSHVAIINETSPIVGCSGDYIVLTCNTIAGAQYQWNLNGFPISGAPNATYTATQSGSYTVTIYVNGCPQSSAAVLVTFNSSPANPSITIVGNIVFCGGGSTTLQANAGFQNYQWKKNGALLPFTTQSISVLETGYYSVSAFDANGCSSSSAQQAINSSFLAPPNMCAITVDSVTQKPVIQWTKPADLGPIDFYILMRESNVADIYDTIANNVPDTSYSSFTDLNASVNTNVKAYKYKLAIQDNCASTTLPSSYHKTILLQTSVGIGNQVNLLWNNYEGIPILTYDIMRGPSPDSLHTLTSIAASNGQFNFYTDVLTNPAETFYYRIDMQLPEGYDCNPTKSYSDRAAIRHSQSNTGSNKTILEDIKNITEINEFKLFPNPSNGIINVNYKSFSNENVGIEVTDLLGKIVHRETWTLSGVDGSKTLYFNQFNNGVYFVTFRQGNKTNTSKFVISK